MSFDQPIGAPFTLASLSKPIGSTNGHVHAAGVCSISGIKKRKRTEIAVGVDGEGVSIYSVGTFFYCEMGYALNPFPAPKSSTRHFLCAAAERNLRGRPVFDLSQRLFEDFDTALYLRFPSRVVTSREALTRVLPR